MNTSWIDTEISKHRWLSPLNELFDHKQIQLFWNSLEPFGRIECDGAVGMRGHVSGRWCGVLYSDFRILGGSYSKKNTDYITAFLKHHLDFHIPLILVLNSAGVRFTQGRSIFSKAFQLIPLLHKLRQHELLITVADEHCLGLAALLFTQGNYRIAIEKSLINLTGPEVHSMFFGKQAGYNEFSSAGYQFTKNSLIHEITSDLSQAIDRARTVISGAHGKPQKLVPEISPALGEMLSSLGDDWTEVFPQLSSVVRTFFVRKGAKVFGAFINPPGRANNMITVGAVNKYHAALELFSARRLPIVSILDCPGGDPRQRESDEDALVKMMDLVHALIDYPYGKMGVVAGRCYGGSGMFGLPRIFGSDRVIALDGARIGIIHESIADRLTASTPRLKEEWNRARAEQKADLSDLVEASVVDEVIPLNQLSNEITSFLDMISERRGERRVSSKQSHLVSVERRQERVG